MARRSKTAVSCCATLLVLVWGFISPVVAQAQEGPQGSAPDAAHSYLIRALSRQIAFVRSFSVEYPFQFRQEAGEALTGAPAASDGKVRGE
jgi:hypothetical protein